MALGVAACLASLSASQPLPPAPGAWTPSYQAPEPLYFSGTNARASGAGYTGGLVNGQTVYVVTAVLKLNGETVRTYQWQSGEPQVSSVSLAVMFDSSHFAHGSTVTVDFVFLDSLGTWRQDDMQAPVKNRLISYGHHEPAQQPRGAPVPVGVFAGLNYATHMRDADGWTGPEMLADMDGATAVQYAGHGSPGSFLDDMDASIFANGTLSDPAVSAFRSQQIGAGLPPFNVTGTPPIGFTLLFACCCGNDPQFMSFLHPGQNAYSPIIEDQCTFAFAATVFNSQYAAMSAVVHEFLAEGFSVYAAREYLVADDRFSVEVGGNEEDMLVAHVRLYGDPYTRLKGVYLPTTFGKSAGWSRGL